jgi:hypothetical protein
MISTVNRLWKTPRWVFYRCPIQEKEKEKESLWLFDVDVESTEGDGNPPLPVAE